ncbi:MAG TPA: hypothetical protein VER17_18045 [Tepidisphaeraceae bacterium]|nr:hypothetical protein [Tepidisphaeraceae bacterium]
MNPERHSRQAARILRGLAELPGGKQVNIVTRKLPRMLSAGPGAAGYQQEERTFPLDHPPHDIPLPRAADDIIITVSGELPADGDEAGDHADDVSRVLNSARSLLQRSGAQWEWDMRSLVRPQERGRQTYQITLFTDAPPNGAGTPDA